MVKEILQVAGVWNFHRPTNLTVDTWTRVTANLSLIHICDPIEILNLIHGMEPKDKLFRSGLEDAAKNNVAKKAEDQEMEFSDFHKKYANDPQETDWLGGIQ